MAISLNIDLGLSPNPAAASSVSQDSASIGVVIPDSSSINKLFAVPEPQAGFSLGIFGSQNKINSLSGYITALENGKLHPRVRVTNLNLQNNTPYMQVTYFRKNGARGVFDIQGPEIEKFYNILAPKYNVVIENQKQSKALSYIGDKFADSIPGIIITAVAGVGIFISRARQQAKFKELVRESLIYDPKKGIGERYRFEDIDKEVFGMPAINNRFNEVMANLNKYKGKRDIDYSGITWDLSSMFIGDAGTGKTTANNCLAHHFAENIDGFAYVDMKNILEGSGVGETGIWKNLITGLNASKRSKLILEVLREEGVKVVGMHSDDLLGVNPSTKSEIIKTVYEEIQKYNRGAQPPKPSLWNRFLGAIGVGPGIRYKKGVNQGHLPQGVVVTMSDNRDAFVKDSYYAANQRRFPVVNIYIDDNNSAAMAYKIFNKFFDKNIDFTKFDFIQKLAKVKTETRPDGVSMLTGKSDMKTITLRLSGDTWTKLVKVLSSVKDSVGNRITAQQIQNVFDLVKEYKNDIPQLNHELAKDPIKSKIWNTITGQMNLVCGLKSESDLITKLF